MTVTTRFGLAADLRAKLRAPVMAKRRVRVKVLAEPSRAAQSFVKGYEATTVRLERY